MNKWLKRFLSGLGVGVASSIPGVSGGTIMVILKVYEGIIWATSHLFTEFKKAVKYLLPIILGAFTAAVPMIFVMDYALEGFLFGAVCIFAGFIFGSIPSVTDELKGKPIKTPYVFIMMIAFAIAVAVAAASVFAKTDVSPHFEHPKWWFYLLIIPVGMFASAALVVPGISGGMLLILLGFYKPLMTSTADIIKQALHGDFTRFWTQMGLLGCFAVGIAIGFLLITLLMNFLLKKYHTGVFYGILGFVMGSAVALFFNFEIYQYYQTWIDGTYVFMPMAVELPVGLVLLVGTCILSYILVKAQRKEIQKEHDAALAEENKTEEEIPSNNIEENK